MQTRKNAIEKLIDECFINQVAISIAREEAEKAGEDPLSVSEADITEESRQAARQYLESLLPQPSSAEH